MPRKKMKTEKISVYATKKQKAMLELMAEKENRSLASLLLNAALSSDTAQEIEMPEPILPVDDHAD